jgi:photosystem II stability/assembly factor-like uncharacterized protein
MKKILLLVFILNISAVYAQWELHSPLPIPEHLYNSYFFSEERGIVYTGDGKLLITNDGFNTFERVNTGGEGNIRQYNFVDDYTGFILMSDGIHKTSDGGHSWNKMEHPLINDPQYIYFMNNDTGWIALNDKLLSTTDAGASWIIRSYINSTNLKFFNTETGLRTSYDRFYKTSDGGLTWSEVLLPGLKVQEIFIKDENTALLITSETSLWRDVQMLLTFDRGETWEPHPTDYDGGDSYNQIFFEDSTIIISHNSKGIRSDDLGETWTEFYYRWHAEVIHIACQKNVYYQLGYGGTILRSNNRGEEWVHIGSRHSNNRRILFVDSLNGFTAPWFVTTDGGNSWQYKDIDIPYYHVFFSYHFTSPTDGIFTYSHNIYRTTDGGLNWDTTYSSENIIGLVFFNKWEGLLFANGLDYNYAVKKTTDGGLTWGDYVQFHLNYGAGFFFAGKNRWFAKHEYDGNGWRTTDGGLSWHDNDFASAHNHTFIDSLNGWGTFPNRLIRTTDGGDTFTTIDTNFTGSALLFIDSLNGFVKRGYNTAFKTTDGGLTWDSLFYPEYVFDKFAVHNGKVFLMGKHGVLYGSTASPTDIEDLNAKVIKNYSLSPNYPNPFNPATTISYTIQNESNVVIKIFDILGNELTTLVNEDKLPGIYKLKWNAADFPSGVYFYRIQAGSFTETKKMILLK